MHPPPQGTPPGGPQVDVDLVEAWVWPAYGDDATGAINDREKPFRTIQAAIDILNAHIRQTHNPVMEGLVWCMPGLYGPTASQTHGPGASGDTFPIQMRHRVHVRGVSARRCVIRGVNKSDPAYDEETEHLVYAPWIGMHCNEFSNGLGQQVLVTFREADKYIATGQSQPYWWAEIQEVDEILDGFTFQGGDVQVSFDAPALASYPQTGRISNCVFDMRDGVPTSSVPIEGPVIGLLMSMHFGNAQQGNCGYYDQKVHIVNNTFVLAEYDGTSWKNDAKFGAVGVVNCTDPNNSYSVNDANEGHRALGNPGLQNNLFRTRPLDQSTNQGTMAMIGIDANDCLVRQGGQGAAFERTNAFATPRAGTMSALFQATPVAATVQGLDDVNGGFFSSPSWEPVYYDAGAGNGCSPTSTNCNPPAAAMPLPRVALWNGSASPVGEHDAGFVGEFLVSQPGTPVLGDYADWRILPGSPLIDQGRLWIQNEFANGSVFREHPNRLLKLAAWDGEGWGNVRVHNGQPDIGFDEFQLGIMAGSYANGSNSHNKVSHLNPTASASQAQRRVLLPEKIFGLLTVNATLHSKVRELQVQPPVPPASLVAWNQPPLTLSSPLVNGMLPSGYQTAYINLSVDKWTVVLDGSMVLSNAPAVQVPTNPPWSVVQVNLPADDEGPNFTSYFNSQFVLDGGSFPQVLRGNLQPEYR